MTRNRIVMMIVLVLLTGAVVYEAVQRRIQSIEIELARDQCQIFREMADKAAAALLRDPPDTKEVIQCLEYTHNYYPSGTKQCSGSKLDSIVENSRRQAEQRIIDALESATGSDLGNDAEDWIEQFGK